MTDTAGPIGIVVVNYASHGLIEANLGPLATGALARVIVVDNFSGPTERAEVSRLAAGRGWDLVAMPDNRGFGAAVNAGAERARSLGCSCLLMLNPDAVIRADAVAALREQCLREPMVMASPRISDSAGQTVFQGTELLLTSGQMRGLGRKPARPDPRERAQLWLTGACLAIHLDLFTQLGGYDEEFFLYWEDVDLSYRAVRAGARLVVRDDLGTVHDEGGTHSGQRPSHQSPAKSSTYYRYNCRNRLLFGARHLDRRDLLRWVLLTPAASWEILMRGGRRQLLHSPRPLAAAARGTVEGLRVALPALVSSQ